MELSDTSALVTGGASGIGAAALEGWRIEECVS